MAKKRPNFLIIVADDLGFSDTGAYGSEIKTPNIDFLARTGLRMTDFHTAPTCSPTRSMLFSGTDNHIAGLGAMWEQMKRGGLEHYEGRRGYEGYLNWDVAALPEVLQDEGYWTTLSGKWHLGLKKELSPHARGFDKSFTYLAGAGSHYNHEPQLTSDIPRLPSLVGTGLWMEDDRMLDREKDLPKDFYSSRTFTDRLLGFFQDRSDEDKEKPFLGCLTFTAPHWPLQADKAAIAKYKGKYDEGPEVLRQQRLAALRERGLVGKDVIPAPVMEMGTSPWEELSAEEKAKSSRAMEIFAAMVDEMDTQIGRVLDYLRSTDELDETFVLFMSDNGAEGQVLEAFPVLNGVSMADVIERFMDNSLENMGAKNSYVWYGSRWASAATAPSRGLKASTNEGGIRCPCIIRYPPLIPAHGTDGQSGTGLDIATDTAGQLVANSISHAFSTVMDIMPTILSLASISHPAPTFRSRPVVSMRGKSWVPLLSSQTSTVYSSEFDFTAWELFGCRAVRRGDHKAILQGPPRGTGDWELYNVKDDPGETKDLAKVEKQILEDLIRDYEVYYQETGMFDAGLAIEMAQKTARSVGKPNEVVGMHGFRGKGASSTDAKQI